MKNKNYTFQICEISEFLPFLVIILYCPSIQNKSPQGADIGVSGFFVGEFIVHMILMRFLKLIL
jgi:hypothetical protein